MLGSSLGLEGRLGVDSLGWISRVDSLACVRLFHLVDCFAGGCGFNPWMFPP